MRANIMQTISANPDLLTYMRQYPEWQRYLVRYPERYNEFYDSYLKERKLTLNDKIDRVNQTIQLVRMFLE